MNNKVHIVKILQTSPNGPDKEFEIVAHRVGDALDHYFGSQPIYVDGKIVITMREVDFVEGKEVSE